MKGPISSCSSDSSSYSLLLENQSIQGAQISSP